MPIQRYTVETTQYTTNIKIYSNCNEIAFINTGTNIAYVDKLPIPVNGYLSINGNKDEYCVNQFSIEFTTQNSSQQLTVVKKTYL